MDPRCAGLGSAKFVASLTCMGQRTHKVIGPLCPRVAVSALQRERMLASIHNSRCRAFLVVRYPGTLCFTVLWVSKSIKAAIHAP